PRPPRRSTRRSRALCVRRAARACWSPGSRAPRTRKGWSCSGRSPCSRALLRHRGRVRLRRLIRLRRLGLAYRGAERAFLAFLRVAEPHVLVAADVPADPVLAAALVLDHALAGVVDLEQRRLDPALRGRVVFLGVRRLERCAGRCVATLADLLQQQLADLPFRLAGELLGELRRRAP